MALHICATCWQKDKVQLPHPESSTSCPYASAWLKRKSQILQKSNEIVRKNEILIDLFLPSFCQNEYQFNLTNVPNKKLKQDFKICQHSKKCEICKNSKQYISESEIEFLIDAHKKVSESGKYNFEECRIPVYSRINVTYIRSWLTDFRDQTLCELLEFGFPFGFNGDQILLKQTNTSE